MKREHEALLLCGCKFATHGINVKDGEEVLCRFHGPQLVVVKALDEWIVNCGTCGFTAYKGAARLGAEVSAAKHRKRKSSHVVTVYTPTGSVHRVFDGAGQLTLGESDITDT